MFEHDRKRPIPFISFLISMKLKKIFLTCLSWHPIISSHYFSSPYTTSHSFRPSLISSQTHFVPVSFRHIHLVPNSIARYTMSLYSLSLLLLQYDYLTLTLYGRPPEDGKQKILLLCILCLLDVEVTEFHLGA